MFGFGEKAIFQQKMMITPPPSGINGNLAHCDNVKCLSEYLFCIYEVLKYTIIIVETQRNSTQLKAR